MAANGSSRGHLVVINAGSGAVLCIVLYVVEYVDYVAGGQKMVCQVMWRGNARNGGSGS